MTMNDRQLEQHLRELDFVEVPAEWRDEILSAAKAVETVPTAKPQCSQMTWFGRAAVIAIWVGLTWSHFLGQREDATMSVQPK